jgi:hypothetical protein
MARNAGKAPARAAIACRLVIVIGDFLVGVECHSKYRANACNPMKV